MRAFLTLLIAFAPLGCAQDRALLDRYCIGCHNSKLRSGQVSLDTATAKTPAENPQLWEKVVRKLRARFMPPAGLPRPDERTYDAVVSSIAGALDSARRGAGPSLIEALTYRLSDHTTADDASRYRSAQEVKNAWALEPLIRTRAFLVDNGQWDADKEQALLQECALKVDAAVTEYLAKSKPSTDAMFEHLFAVLPAHLHEQRLVARKYGAKTSGH